MTLTLKQFFQNRRLLIDTLAIFFGIGGLLGANSLFVELPVLINNAPEGPRLPTHMTLMAQLGNLSAILYSVYIKCTSPARDHMLMIYALLGGGAATMLALAFLHEETSYVFGAERSIALLGFSYVQTLVSCVAPILFMPYMKNYRDIYLASYLVGEGVSGFISSMLALIQGVGGNPQCVNSTDPNSETQFVEYYPDPRFSTTILFALNGGILFLSFAAFVALSKISARSTERASPSGNANTSLDGVETTGSRETAVLDWKMPRKTYVYLMVLTWLISTFENGASPTLQSYSCLSYGNVAYHLAVTLGFIANPLAMCVCVLFKKPRIDVISYLTLAVVFLVAFVSYLAVMSPAPPLQHTWVGAFVVVTAWVVAFGLTGFVRLSILTLFQSESGVGLFYAGLAILIGSLSGAVITFCLVELTNIFGTFSPCADYVAVTLT